MYVIITTYDWTEETDVFKVRNQREGKQILRTLFLDCCKGKHDSNNTFINKQYAQVVKGINKTVFRLAKVDE